jgi:hypothetical protein
MGLSDQDKDYQLELIEPWKARTQTGSVISYEQLYAG